MTTQLTIPGSSNEPSPTNPMELLRGADIANVNHSGGKDSSDALRQAYTWARQADVTDRLVVLHNDLGRVEWPGTTALDARHADHYRKTFGGTLTELLGDRPSARDVAERQAAAYGLPFLVYSRTRGDLLQQIEQYGKWPDANNRHCTSDQKRGPKHRWFTEAVRRAGDLDRKVIILDINGERADESPARARKPAYEHNRAASNKTLRDVWTWRIIHNRTEAQVWASHTEHDLPWHWAYDAGMSRLSCSLCVLGSVHDITLACLLRPDLAAEYHSLEQRINHLFKNKRSIGWYIDRAAELLRNRIAAGEPILASRPHQFLASGANPTPARSCGQNTEQP
ncbi:phosphoadenosine phosphosulfate reductase domain-containing protein [Actinomadura sp. 3N407]|uniref:phosphoadenosine phosphosulfate reductase domain-containing protein n=1 Tax=Actinomadura sp. 3N407 TaxID=3457423 RepID=UPI003FCCB2D3